MEKAQSNPVGEILLYEAEGGNVRVECRFVDETLWLSQALIGELYGVSVKTVNEHLKNLYDGGELTPEATIRKFRIVQTEGKRQVHRNIDHYNLEAILAVGKRGGSKADYIRMGAQDDEFHVRFVTDYLEKFGKASRAELDKLLIGKMSEILDQKQKKNKISNLLTRFRRSQVIENKGSKKSPEWTLAEKNAE